MVMSVLMISNQATATGAALGFSVLALTLPLSRLDATSLPATERGQETPNSLILSSPGNLEQVTWLPSQGPLVLPQGAEINFYNGRAK